MSSGVQTAAHHSSQFHHTITSQYQELRSKMTPGPNNSEDHHNLVNIHPHLMQQPPIATTSRQVSRDSDISFGHNDNDDSNSIPGKAPLLKTEISSSGLQAASVITPRPNAVPQVSSTKTPLLSAEANNVVRQEASSTISAPHNFTISSSPSQAQEVTDLSSPSAGTKRKIAGSPTSGSSTPVSRRDSLPTSLRNKKMKATDCLLFAATLLEQETAEALVAVRSSPPAPARTPIKKTKPLKKMVCEKLERSLQEEAAKQKELEQQRQQQEQELLQQEQQQQQEPEDQDSENKPNDADVLCGRGGKVNKHPGNIVYRKVVEYNKSYYQSVHKKHRILVSQSIVRAILNYGGRFMGQKGKEWTPICFKRAVQKTSQALRERSNSSEGGGADFAATSTTVARKTQIAVEATAPKD